MTRTTTTLLIAAALAGATAARATTQLTTIRVANGLTRPCWVTAPPGDKSRLFVIEQREATNHGRIRILKGGALQAKAFLTTPVLSSGSEQGLLGLAFAPDYDTSKRFYVDYTDASGNTQLVRYLVSGDPDRADSLSATTILSVTQPYSNHNGGWIAFGPDGYLYMSLGDGGSGGDPEDRAQNINVLLGKILRLDVSGAGYTSPPTNPFYGSIPGLDQIWSWGLRNPWRNSFDRATGDLVIGDVGQNLWEEIDFAPVSQGAGKGVNFGWRCWEGNAAYTSSITNPCASCTSPSCPMQFPAYVFSHTLGRCSVTGGYVYRGCAIPDLQGTYFFADYCGNQIYSGRFSGNSIAPADRTAELAPGGGLSINSISSFGEDASGELYICDLGGEVFKIVPRTGVAESDMPALRVAMASGDTLGSTAPGNAFTPGMHLFADAGSRIRGVGYLKNATIRDCTQIAATCLTSHMRLAPFDIDLVACVDADSSKLTRTFVFKNTSAASQNLAYVDVLAPYLASDADQARNYDGQTATQSPLLGVYESNVPAHPARWVTNHGFATGATFATDVDSAAALISRVAADAPLTGRLTYGPGRSAMAISFDFGAVAPAAAETVVVVTRLQQLAPVGVEPGVESILAPRLRVAGPMPFRSQLQLALDVPRGGRSVRLEVFDVLGRRIRHLVDGTLSAGAHPVNWDGRNDHGISVGAGIYFVRLCAGATEQSLRVVRLQ
jgi:glucose/arabinose dehydrogenase